LGPEMGASRLVPETGQCVITITSLFGGVYVAIFSAYALLVRP